jgi:hypothetical protein
VEEDCTDELGGDRLLQLLLFGLRSSTEKALEELRAPFVCGEEEQSVDSVAAKHIRSDSMPSLV